MHAGLREYHAYLGANFLVVTLLIALLSAESYGGDLLDFGQDLPELEFDVPAKLVAHDVTPGDYRSASEGERLIQVRVPVSVVVTHGEVRRVQEVIIEIDGSQAGLVVHDFSPDTHLASEVVDAVEVQRIEEQNQGLDGSLGGALPVAGGTAHLTPSVTAGTSSRTATTVREKRLPPKQAVLVSGAVNRRQGVYFKLRQSSQTTLEGEHELTITFVAPEGWEGGALQVECVARGEKKYLFVKHRKVWNASRAPIEVLLANYEVAKPICDCEQLQPTPAQLPQESNQPPQEKVAAAEATAQQ